MLDADVDFSDVGDICSKGFTVGTTAIVGTRRATVHGVRWERATGDWSCGLVPKGWTVSRKPATLAVQGDPIARLRIAPFPAPARGGEMAASDLPGTADAGIIDLHTPIIRPYVAPYSAEFRHQAVLRTWSTGVPVTHVARDLGISIGTLRDWITQARHDPRQLHEGTSETVQAELVRLRSDNHHLLREIAILSAALGIDGTADKRGGR